MVLHYWLLLFSAHCCLNQRCIKQTAGLSVRCAVFPGEPRTSSVDYFTGEWGGGWGARQTQQRQGLSSLLHVQNLPGFHQGSCQQKSTLSGRSSWSFSNNGLLLEGTSKELKREKKKKRHAVWVLSFGEDTS